MAIQQKTVTILGTEYMLTQLPAIKGMKILKQLTKIVGPAVAAMQSDGDKVRLAMEALFDNLDGPVEELIVALVQTATKGNIAINFDMEFAGEYDKLFLLVKEVVEFNYGSVFTMFGSAV